MGLCSAGGLFSYRGKIMIEQFDEKEIYCRKLGHHLKFVYCRSEHEGYPCPLIFDCWHEKLDIGAYMRENFKPREVEYLIKPAPNRMASLLDLIQQARQRSAE